MIDENVLQAAEMAVLRGYGLKMGDRTLNDLEAQKREYRFQQSPVGRVVIDHLEDMAEEMRKISGHKTPVDRLCPLIDAKTNTIERFFIQKGK